MGVDNFSVILNSLSFLLVFILITWHFSVFKSWEDKTMNGIARFCLLCLKHKLESNVIIFRVGKDKEIFLFVCFVLLSIQMPNNELRRISAQECQA